MVVEAKAIPGVTVRAVWRLNTAVRARFFLLVGGLPVALGSSVEGRMRDGEERGFYGWEGVRFCVSCEEGPRSLVQASGAG